MGYKSKEKQQEYDRKRYYDNLEGNRKRVKLYMREKRKQDPEKIKEIVRKSWKKNKDKYLPKQKERYEQQKEDRLEKQKQYYKEHREERLAYNKKYVNSPKGKERRRICALRRRAWKNNIIETYTLKEWTAKRLATNGICPMCGKNVGVENLQLDHIYPISKAEEGRIYTIDDIQPLCGKCNNKKNNRILNS